VPHERELGVDPLLEREEPQLFQTLDLRVCEWLVREVGESAAAPKRERRFERSERPGGVTRCVGLPPFLEQALEPVRIDLLSIDLEDVAAAPRE
jgi:hypothetical protein